MTEQGTVPHQAASGSDEQALLLRLRGGEDAAFGELFELHAAAVRRLARSIASDQSEAEDITAETFFRVLQAIRRGAGPRDYVRAYLLTVARRVSWEWHGARRDVPVSDDELTFRVGAGADTHARSAEHTLITTAFTSLPERWRTVLWQTEVEGEQPAMVAPHFGLSANATAALARRARQGLRAAYLQAHLAVNRSSDGCRAVVEKLGGYTAGSVTGTEARRIRTHLLGCTSCRATHDELRDVCSSLRAHAGVVVLLVPAAALGFGGGGGVLAAVKSVLVGSKIKVGMALASTAAAGAFGIAVGPAVFDADSHQTVGLSGKTGDDLRVDPQAPVPEPPQIALGIDQLNVKAAGPFVHHVSGDVARGGAAGVPLGAPQNAGTAPDGGAGIPPAKPGTEPGFGTTEPSGEPRLDPPPAEATTTSARDDAPLLSETAAPDSSQPSDTEEPSCKPKPSYPWSTGTPPWRPPSSSPKPTTTADTTISGSDSATSPDSTSSAVSPE
ncbi:sigma-70 family RNA polymerase sigma factor [Amycolatopsis sp.]|jgi:RNA polymerase sigma factor (sigma-70 family)|uniref:sigma-70 family RNA polymerase sigma factor n=1 Tax=Amycolatopsis sp. TaxID=37632 RepID=UPI002DFE5C79|nr:sigma-70 family RNA polymerase sigma factor [Amycolatopsis sp.]